MKILTKMLISSLLAANIFFFPSNKHDSLKSQALKILRPVKDDWAPVSVMGETLTGAVLRQDKLRWL